MISPSEARAELGARIRAKDSLLAFTGYTHPDWQTGTHHEVICDRLEAVERGDIKRLIITAPPRHTKSELASRRFPAWYMGRNPGKQIITTTYGDDLASDFGRDVREIVASPQYRNVFDTELLSDSRAAGKWRTNKGGIYVSTGIGGPITGRGADLALIDDYVKNRMDADSETTRESIWRWYTSTLYTRLQPGGAVIIVATRWHEDDLIGRCLQQDHENWQLIDLKAIDNDKALWPEWYPLEALEQIRATLPPRDWEALYQQDPQPDTGTFFQRDWFHRHTEPPPHLNCYMTTDFAVTDSGGDYTEFGVWGLDESNRLYAVDWWYGQKTMDVWIDALLQLYDVYRPYVIYGESGVIKQAVEPFLNSRCREKNIYPYFEWITRQTDKVSMARSFQGRASMGMVSFPKTRWADRVVDQLVGFPAGKYDDAVDVCALMGRALDGAGARTTKDEALDQALGLRISPKAGPELEVDVGFSRSTVLESSQMATTEHGSYRFTVKESEGATFLACEPAGEELEILENRLLALTLDPKTGIEQAQDLANSLNALVSKISVTSF